MRKKEALAMIITLTLGLATGCAPGDISRYAAKAQQAGEAIFEGRTVPAAAEIADAPGEEETAAEKAESVEETETVPETGKLTASKQESSPADESLDGSDADTGSEDSGGAGSPSEESGAAAETEENAEIQDAAEAQNTSESQDAAEAQSTAESQNTAETQSTSKSQNTAEPQQAQPAELPAMMKQVGERVQTAMAERADWIVGSLAGRDTLTKAQQDALQAVLKQQSYGDKTLCLISSASFEGKETGSFLLFYDSTALTARGKVNGDLWFFTGDKAVSVLKNAEFTQLQSIECGGRDFLLIQTQKGGKTNAQAYRVKDGKPEGCFVNAVFIEPEGDELRVSYQSDHVQYDPASGEWSGGKAAITYFYVPGEDDLEQESVRKLTAEQYLAYIQPDEADAEAQDFKRAQEEKFYNTYEAGQECSYSFFALGNDRIGYRECRIGLPEQETDENSHAVAEYTYYLAKLENGKLTQQCESLSGSGYYFAQWDQKEEELQSLSEIPAMYLKNRIDRAERTLQPGERIALQSVQAIQEYDTDGLCFVEQADYDGDGKKESFVAIGRYDGILNAPVCDLWFVAGEEAVQLEEKLPLKAVFSFEKEGISLFLTEGFEADGARKRLYGVKEAAAQRYLKNASEIEVEENGDLTARIGELPFYYHVVDGEVAEYSVQEKEPEMLLDYDNGKAVYRQLQRLEKLQEGELSCLVRENGMIHVMLTDKNGGVSYETYRVQNGSLVLVDCGEGGYEVGAQKADEAEAEDGEQGSADGKKARESEAGEETKEAEAVGKEAAGEEGTETEAAGER